ncbi:MAG TPA: DUF6515 family protein [Mucilaginibacter sp.]|jgi:hypothetical protein|nr:DUF6515 family protein [Mucilaginibacter sp.]
MKNLNKYAAGLLFAGALTVMTVVNADAQRGGGHSGGGGFHGGGGLSFRGGGGYRGSYGGYGYRGGLGLGIGLGFGYPALGFYLNALPFGYYPFYVGSSLYYYADGTFYSPYEGGGYVVATPPVGAAVPKLPKGARPIMIDNQQFYQYNGVYYKAVVNDKGEKVFVVAGKDGVLNTDGDNADNNVSQPAQPQVGDIVNQIPDNSRKVTLNGKKYLVSPDDIYFEKITDRDGNVAYKIVSIPDQDNNN